MTSTSLLALLLTGARVRTGFGAIGRGRLRAVAQPREPLQHRVLQVGGDGLCAKITKVTDGQKTDDKNPDPAKRSQPIVGLVIMESAKKTGANKWSGTLYNRENGKSYAGTITVKSKDAVDLSGCVAAVLCRTVTWTRIK